MKKKKNQTPETGPEARNTDGSGPKNSPNTPMRTAIIVAVAALILLCAAAWVWNNGSQNRGTAVVYFFYGEECPHCHEVMPHIESLQKKYPDVDFRLIEVWHNETNSSLKRLFDHRFGIAEPAVPEAFVGNVSMYGTDEIEAGLEPAILKEKGNLTGTGQVGAVPVTGTLTPPNATVTAFYYYGNGCSHCEAVEPLVSTMEARYPWLHVERLEINDNRTNRDRLLATYARLNLTGGSIPTLVVGDRALAGEAEVRDHIEEAVLAEEQRALAGPTGSLVPLAPDLSPRPANATVDAIYFYGARCSHCESVKPVIQNISSRYPDLNLTWLEIDDSAENRDLLIAMSSRYGIPNPGTPTIFIGNHVLVGEGDVTERFESEILAERQRIASGVPLNTTPATTTAPPQAAAFSPLMVVFGALVDSTNPCGLSVLVFLLISMVAAGERRRILLAGAMYIAAMFLFHLLVGIGLFSAFSLSGLAKPFSILGGLIALALGLVTLADVLRNRETYLLSIPESGKGMLGTYIRKATLPGAFILGILAGIFGFTCTGGIYISILGLMGRQMTFLSGLPWLILYNIIYVLPLVILTLLVAYGISPERADRWRTENKRAIRVVIGIILVGLGIVILAGWFG